MCQVNLHCSHLLDTGGSSAACRGAQPPSESLLMSAMLLGAEYVDMQLLLAAAGEVGRSPNHADPCCMKYGHQIAVHHWMWDSPTQRPIPDLWS